MNCPGPVEVGSTRDMDHIASPQPASEASLQRCVLDDCLPGMAQLCVENSMLQASSTEATAKSKVPAAWKAAEDREQDESH